MGCYRNILAAFDGSADAGAALKHAAALARDLHAKLIVVTVVPPPMYVGGIGAGATTVADVEQLLTRELHQAIAALPRDVSIEARVARGRPADHIREMAEKCCSDLIVMGFHGHSRLRQAVRGSVSDTVVRNSARPVLLVRAGCTPPSTVAAGVLATLANPS
jgi:nucleotide-binding universal stress UspA family protein